MSSRKEQVAVAPLLLVGLGLLFMIAAAVWLVRASNQSAARKSAAAAPAITPPAQAAEVERVSLEEAKAAFDLKQAVFIDARGEQSYAEGHIPGAIPMTSGEVTKRVGELDPNTWVLTYCT